MIEPHIISQIFDASQITEVVGEFVTLKKRGVNYLGICPFHSEKTPSFTVSPAKNIFKCFGCGKGGNPVNFIMEHEHLSYVEALRYLARKYHIEIVERESSPEDIKRYNEIESLGIVSEYAAQYFREQLHASEEGKNIGLSYFKERGFRDDIITKFELGYSPDKSDEFSKTAIKNGYKLEFLTKTGLTIENERGLYDRFHGRVMFPIRSLSGKVIAFGGRTLRSDKNVAKYLNSPESDIYHKSKVLYGIYEAKKSITQFDKCYLVEGYTDVISMHQAGIENVVASSGTSLTTDQIRLIKRFTNNITILYDGDAAGIKASLRGIDMILEEGMNVKVLLFPDNEDPDSFSRKHNASEVLDFISKNETDFMLFKTRLLIDDSTNDPIKRAMLIQDIIRSIATIPDPVVRSVYIKECSILLDTHENIIYSQTNKIRREKAEQKFKTKSPEPNGFDIDVPPIAPIAPVESRLSITADPIEIEIIRLLLTYGDKIINVSSDEEEKMEFSVAEYIITDLVNDDLVLQYPVYKQIFEEVQYHLTNKIPLTEKYFINHSDTVISQAVVDILSQHEKYKESRIWKKNNMELELEENKLSEMVLKIIMVYKEKAVLKQLKEIQLELLGANDDEEKSEELWQRYMILTNFKKDLSKMTGDRIIMG